MLLHLAVKFLFFILLFDFILSLACFDLWDAFVDKKAPIVADLNKDFTKFYETEDLRKLFENAVVGQKYTMFLKVSSTCPKDVKIGFSGEGGWFKTNVPANSNGVQIIVNDVWKGDLNTRFESRIKCKGSTITIHKIQLIKGTENCLNHKG